MNLINPSLLEESKKAELKEAFRAGKPFPHIVIDNFLKEDVADRMYEKFPKVEQLRKHYKNINENKSEGSSFDQYDPVFGDVRNMIISDEFMQFLHEITGIEDLSYADDHRGTGLHQGLDGSFLDVHVDFSVHPIMNLHRRLNILIFANKNWKDEYGGHFELWDAKVKNMEQKVAPNFNRFVMFEASDHSYHGYGKINVPEGESRKSMYAYYFTPVGENVKYHDTIFKARPTESNSKKVKTYVKENLKNAVKKTIHKLGMKKVFDKFE